MVTVFRADTSDEIVQRRNAYTDYQPVGWFEAFLAIDFSEMRARFSHDFRLLVVSVVAFLGSLYAA
jgi:hypothetical protein